MKGQGMNDMQRRLSGAVLTALLWTGLATVPPAAAQPARHVEVTPETVVRVATKVRYTTVIVVPADEQILTFVCGDSEYWALEGTANIALLKPMKQDVSTNVALITDRGSIYTLTAREGEAHPDLKVFLHRPAQEPATDAGPVGTPLQPLAFVAAAELEGWRLQAERATREARDAKRTAQELVETGVETFRQRYPSTLRFDYRLPPEAAASPWHVRAMWHDQRFTYLLCTAPEAPALYEEKDGKPALVAFDYEDGLYVARHVLQSGWLQVGRKRLKWRYDPPPELP